jgi:branched-chain amino acid transport system ATP-binding protein
MTLLKVERLSKSFKALQVLKNIHIDVNENERHVIIGPNGAGKTTLFHCISGVIPMDEGQVVINNTDVTTSPGFTRVASGMARTFQKNNLFQKLSIAENLHLAISSGKPYKWRLFKPLVKYEDLNEETEQLLKEWNLWDRRNRIVNELSYGEQRLLEIMLAIASKPKILMLDEPTSGMSPAETGLTTKLIQQLPRSISLLVIEHDMEVVFALADRITVLHHGEVFLTGKPEEIRGDERVREIYFGGGAAKHA